MIRTALKPAWLALLALLIAVVVSFYQLGMWQIGVSSNTASREHALAQAARPTEPLGEVTGPHRTFPADGAGLSVRAQGEYLPERQFLVPDRVLEGRDGYWVVTPLLTEASGTPAVIPVMRGFVTDPGLADRPASAPVTVEGTLAPAESPVGGPFPEGQRGAIDTADLANAWEEPIYNAFVFLVEEAPALTAGAVERVPPPVFGETGVVWRNFGYGLQWFVFAAFACYMYYRFLKDATDKDRAASQEPAARKAAPHTAASAERPPAREGDPA